MGLLDEILGRLKDMPAEARLELEVEALKGTKGMRFIPNPGPQTDAYYCLADELFFGGGAGGGKSSLVCGLAVSEHKHSHIFRRESTQLRGIVQELTRMLGTSDGFNSQQNIWKIDGKLIELGGIKDEDDKEKWQGRAASLKAFDEITQFSETQYRYIIGWNRSSDPKERCRVVCTGNPPTTPEGYWVVKYWGAWLDQTHPNPAKPAELRFYTTVNGEDKEVSADYVGPKGERPRSRTFIPAKLEDNPDLLASGYASVIESMPEPLRTMMREGRFDIAAKDGAYQVIPTAWVLAAQARWNPDGWKGKQMTCMALDPAGGGKDACELVSRYTGWFSELVTEKGPQTAEGSTTAAMVVKHRKDGAPVVVDMGGGYAGGVTQCLTDNDLPYIAFNGAGETTEKTKGGQQKGAQLGFQNKRAWAIWRMREELDPDQQGGSVIALPPDPELRADLCAPTWKLTTRGILIESKDDIRKRLGRSTGKGDAVCMALAPGELAARLQINRRTTGRPSVVMNRPNAKPAVRMNR